ncbi:MAG: putative enoyl-CoA hydratase echA8 [Acidimicrobiales bacterium]|nr:putative enoyl-CoA hydratase echA8 [Acidimicrobiales bacterium]
MVPLPAIPWPMADEIGEFEQVIVERDGAVAQITLNRPDRMNAWTWTMSAELARAFGVLDADACRAIVVTGSGKAFCAGADLGGGGKTFSGESDAIGTSEDAAAVMRARPPSQLNTPIIAAINGAAVGAGLTMTMEWDLRVAAEDAKLGFVFNRRGVMPDADLLWLIPRLIGASAAMDLLLTGRILRGQEAFDLGLVHRCTPPDQVLGVAIDLAHDIASNTAPVSAAITKRVLWEFLAEPDRAAATRRQHRLFGWTGQQPDAAEGVMAFLEKRSPTWKLAKTGDYPEDL